MLPVNSCGIAQIPRGVQLEREGTATMLEGLGGGEGIGPDCGILDQVWEGLTLMVMGHRVAQPPPEPLDPITVGIVGGRVDEAEVIGVLRDERAEQLV